MLATELAKRPVVTLAGEDVGQVKDVVFEGGGRVAGFTLSGRGLLAGPMKQALPIDGVTGLGPDAVMISDEYVFESRKQLAERAGAGVGGDVLGARVLSDGGVELGRVTDVVLQTTRTTAVVVGYQIAATEALGHPERTVYLPLAETVAVSGEALVVPARAAEYVADDLPGFEDLVRGFRERMGGGTARSDDAHARSDDAPVRNDDQDRGRDDASPPDRPTGA
ncbi:MULTISPECIES: PRC-barrel domain-containing protein [unclassified Streptomyces]|uniref:PRC-barrel domain-containing protein n=1 Tax=unclassified Streptomyces TaxID=2593676 RepID=UPI0022B6828E|nr:MULTISPECIES: PRC-barrel domain-containing protein [unclassified Streptomyces]MCZ7413990.1 PRC-barrel domain-containing protein [Streptomyces sp. WMMC897]MCZ7430986.1 PRC-barrel domain-containing protein [Streptomyces sp. WMMC1477]